MKFVFVSGRSPRPQSCCALCSKPIAGGYLRDIATRLPYCDYICYARDREDAVLPRQLQARAS
jgi:hypothetical protein